MSLEPVGNARHGCARVSAVVTSSYRRSPCSIAAALCCSLLHPRPCAFLETGVDALSIPPPRRYAILGRGAPARAARGCETRHIGFGHGKRPSLTDLQSPGYARTLAPSSIDGAQGGHPSLQAGLPAPLSASRPHASGGSGLAASWEEDVYSPRCLQRFQSHCRSGNR